MQLPYTLDEFTRERWEDLFGAFTKANNSHWRGAPFDAVINLLKTKGEFSWAVTAMNTWTCRFMLRAATDGRLETAFIPNNELSAPMRERLTAMQRIFESEVNKLQ
jgi:hypothetical protein